MNGEFNFDVLDEVKEDVGDEIVKGNGDKVVQTQDVVYNSFCTFWRSKAMMSIVYNKDKLLLKFMLGAGADPKKNSYNKDSRVFFQLNKEELFQFVCDMNKFIASLKTDNPTNVQLIHEIKEGEMKKLDVYAAKDKKSVFINLKYKNNNYAINLDWNDLKFFMFALKLILYEMYTGTRVGFTYDWI